jgi:hypothetical protein
LQVASGTDVKFKNRATGQYIDGLGKTADGSNLGQWKTRISNNQIWTVSTVSGLSNQGVAANTTTNATQSSVELYPNPFSSSFTLRGFKPGEILHIRIFDVTVSRLKLLMVHAGLKQVTVGASLKRAIM